MDNRASKFLSILVITLSQYIIKTKKQSLDRIKLRSVNKTIKKIQKLDYQSVKKSNSDVQSYMSISDFKPLNNIYSSVKIFQQDFNGKQFQTRKEKIKQALNTNVENKIKLQDWMIAKRAKMILAQNYPKSMFYNKSIQSYSEQALHAIKICNFQQFCKNTLKKNNSIFSFNEQKQLKYKKCSISNSILHLPDIKVQIAIDIFDILLMAGGQKQGNMPTIWYIWKFIYQIFQQIQDIRQQAYFQIIKQLSSNKKIYYQIFACLSATVQPSSRMYLPLLSYIYYQSKEPILQIYNEYHNFIFYSLIKNFSNPRKACPSITQLFSIMNLRKIPLLISFPRQNIFFMQFYSTVEQILSQLTQLYGINKNQSYLFNIQGILLEKGSILDGLNKARMFQKQQQNLNHLLHFQGLRAFIIIKNMLQINKNQQNFLIMYNYIVNQYRRGLFAVTNKVAFQIGGLIIASEIQIQDLYEFSLAKYIPRKKYIGGLSLSKMQHVQKIIINQYSKFKGTKMQARKKVLQILSKSKAFLTHFFLCNIFFDEQQYTQAWVGLKTSSMIIVQPGTSRIILHVEYEKIKKWGRSVSQICLKIDRIGTLHIQCAIIQTLISIFVNYLNYLRNECQALKQKQNQNNIPTSKQKINV